MKTRKMYSSKEEAERLNPYVVVNFSEYQPASIVKNCSCKRTANNYVKSQPFANCLQILTRKQATKQIAEFNKKYFN